MTIDLTGIKTFAKATLAGDVSGHDLLHANQVANLALNLYQSDQGQPTDQDRAVLLAAGFLHDTIDDKVVSDVFNQKQQVVALLASSNLATEKQMVVLDTIEHLSYSANLKRHYQLDLLGQYVQDADRLEALGAIGIGRVFAYGGQQGQPLYDPAIKPVLIRDKNQYRQHQTTSINHFYEKLLRLAEQLNTPAGHQEGQRRTAFIKAFLTEFQRETGALSDAAFQVD